MCARACERMYVCVCVRARVLVCMCIMSTRASARLEWSWRPLGCTSLCVKGNVIGLVTTDLMFLPETL